MTSSTPLIALTMGDPAGIGPDIALAAWTARRAAPLGPFVALGDPALYRTRARDLGLDVPVQAIDDGASAAGVFDAALPVLPIPLPRQVAPGKPEASAAAAVIASIEAAVDLVFRGIASAVVTSPINKKQLYGAAFRHMGHTDFLGQLARDRGAAASPVMMMVCDELRVVPATIHVPLKAVPGLLTRDLLRRTVRITAEGLGAFFGIAAPRIVVTGLNPHAGEEGALGSEEVDVIAPAIAELRAEGLSVSGPYPADTLFQERLRGGFDAAITMYHDQALIPVKTLAFDRTVNLTLGLPFVRTSPDHGTAYDLAGTGRASPQSLIEAIRLAGKLGARHKVVA